MAKGNPNPVPFDGFYNSKVKKRLDMVRGWARNGLSNVQIAENLGIGESTFARYMKEHEELADVVEDGRYHAEIHIENALFKRATGYKYNEITRERKPVRDEDGNIIKGEYELAITKKVVKEVQPDANAAQYWLERRAPKRWERNPTPGIDPVAINAQVNSLAQLLGSPLPERKIGCEQEDEDNEQEDE